MCDHLQGLRRHHTELLSLLPVLRLTEARRQELKLVQNAF